MTKPIVDGLERDLDNQVEIIRVDLLSELGRAIASGFDVRAAPTTILFDGEGDIVLADTGIPSRGKFRDAALALLNP